MPTLSSSIVKHSVATMREVEDALARQVLYGGDLLTNLLEITQVDELRLLDLLSQLHGLQAGPSGLLPRASAETLRLLPSDVASRHAVYPLDEQGGALVVCVAHPLPEDVESDLCFLLGVRLEQRVAPRARIAQAIARDYGVPLDRRSARIVARLDGEPDPHPSEGPPAIDLPLNLADVPRPPSVPPIAFPPATELPSVPPPAERSDIHEAQTDNVPEVALRELVKQSQPPPPPDFPQEIVEIPKAPSSLPSPQAELSSSEQALPPAPTLELFGPASDEVETTVHRRSEPAEAPAPAEEQAVAEDPAGAEQAAGAAQAAAAEHAAEPEPEPSKPKPNEENQRTQPSLRVPPLSTQEYHPNVSLHPSAMPAESALESKGAPAAAETPPAQETSVEAPSEPAAEAQPEPSAEAQPEPTAQAQAEPKPDEPAPAPAPSAAPAADARAEAPEEAPPVSIGPSPSERLANLGRDVERWKAAEPKPRRRGPYTAAEAEQDLVDAESRDEVLSAFFDYAQQYFEYTALFAVQGDLAEGRSASGPGATTGEVRGIGVPLDLPGILRSAKLAGTPTLQALVADGLDKSLSDDLKRPSDGAKLAIPVSVRKHCVLILYGCEGKTDVQLDAVGQVLAFAPLVSQALERVILRRKLAVRREVKRDLPGGLAQLAEARKRDKAEQFKDQPSPEARANALVSALSAEPKKRTARPPKPEATKPEATKPEAATTPSPRAGEVSEGTQAAAPEPEEPGPEEPRPEPATQAHAAPASQRPTEFAPPEQSSDAAVRAETTQTEAPKEPVPEPETPQELASKSEAAAEPSADLSKTLASEPPKQPEADEPQADLTKTLASEPPKQAPAKPAAEPKQEPPAKAESQRIVEPKPATTPANLAQTMTSGPREAKSEPVNLAKTLTSAEPKQAPEKSKPASIAPSRTIVIGPSSSPPPETHEASPPTVSSPRVEQREDSGEQEPIPLSKQRSKATAVLGSLAKTEASVEAPKGEERRSSTPPQGTPISVSQLNRLRKDVLPPNSRRVPALLEKEAEAAAGEQAKAKPSKDAPEPDKPEAKKRELVSSGKTVNLGSLPDAASAEPAGRPSEPPVFPLTRRSGGKMRVADSIEYEAEHRTDPGIGSQPLPEPPRSEEGPEISVSAVDERVSYPDEEFLEEAPLAASSRRMSVAPSVPTSRHDTGEIHLPKVIVNEADTHDLVKDLIDGNEIAFEAIVEDGKRSLGALLAAFPGPIHAEQKPVGSDGPIKASECGPILRALAAIGRDAVGFVAVRTQDRDPIVRGWATRLLGELPCGESARNVARRVTDKEPDVRRAALAAGRMLLSDEASRSELLRTLIQYANDAHQSEDAAHAAIEMLADLREGRAVPALIDLLDSQYTDIAKSAQWALVVLTRQDFTQDQKGWEKWWKANSSRHRVEWLIDALLHDVPEIRRAAGDELKSLTKEYFGYYDDLPKAERKKAQARYKEWWESRGKARFR